MLLNLAPKIIPLGFCMSWWNTLSNSLKTMIRVHSCISRVRSHINGQWFITTYLRHQVDQHLANHPQWNWVSHDTRFQPASKWTLFRKLATNCEKVHFSAVASPQGTSLSALEIKLVECCLSCPRIRFHSTLRPLYSGFVLHCCQMMSFSFVSIGKAYL